MNLSLIYLNEARKRATEEIRLPTILEKNVSIFIKNGKITLKRKYKNV